MFSLEMVTLLSLLMGFRRQVTRTMLREDPALLLVYQTSQLSFSVSRLLLEIH